MADKAAFLNMIRSLFNIDGYQLPELTTDQQSALLRDPVRYFIGTDKAQSDAIFREVMNRQAPTFTGLEVEAAPPGTGEKLLTIARDFIDKHQVSCAEATAEDGVYAEAPLLVEQLAEVVGYYSHPEDVA